MKEFRIEGRHAGKRLDRFMEEIEHWPHGMVVKAIRMKKLKVNGKKEDGTYRLCEGDRVVSYVLPKEKRRDFTIVYEDEHILIADKKAGLLCMDSTGKTTRTLIGEVNEYLADKGEPSAYMVHRIDFNTSGLPRRDPNTAPTASLEAPLNVPLINFQKYASIHPETVV